MCKRDGADARGADGVHEGGARRRGLGGEEAETGCDAAGSDVVVDFLALPSLLVAAARAQALARQHGDHLLGRRAGREFVADAIGHHGQARALPTQRLGDCPAAFVTVAIPFIADSLAITALFHRDSLTRLRERGWTLAPTRHVPAAAPASAFA
ncbi:hypothetical protein Bcep18194_B1363 [Burkholderia lata]|uniref:Uncharacterized protein n=1 Tax=Burkholderia lata (strain ATCC 17760 / DSM 23089 / LMG 22485 / NCIMB 9086 / R18194 / 383) TaxID=482957 RepID=Q396Y4_BURL3|nr:hypothetical protein Bcep18194_B1363 [Burkholderia lata]